MDPTAVAAFASSAASARVQMAVAAKLAKMNAQQGQAVADLLASAAEGLKAALPQGTGQTLDVSA
jgi:hypothetical protein